MKQIEKTIEGIDYCICHKFLKKGEEVLYSALEIQTTVHYDGDAVWQETGIIDSVIFNCNNCGKQMPEKVEEIIFG